MKDKNLEVENHNKIIKGSLKMNCSKHRHKSWWLLSIGRSTKTFTDISDKLQNFKKKFDKNKWLEKIKVNEWPSLKRFLKWITKRMYKNHYVICSTKRSTLTQVVNTTQRILSTTHLTQNTYHLFHRL